MPAITASMVAALRAKTDAPMMECKKALTEAEGDLDRAEELLRIKLGNKAGKAASRITAEGVVAASVEGSAGALVEVNCETDFVTKNDSFLAFAQGCADLVRQHAPADMEALSALAYSQDGFGPTLEEVRKGLIGKIGENMTVRRFKHYAGGGTLASYLHGTRIGVLVEYEGDAVAAKDVAMHVAAMKPVALSSADVPSELIEKERKIASEKAAEDAAAATAAGKPAQSPEIVAKRVDGSVQKYLKEVSLFNQTFVKNDKQTVEQMLKAQGTSSGASRSMWSARASRRRPTTSRPRLQHRWRQPRAAEKRRCSADARLGRPAAAWIDCAQGCCPNKPDHPMHPAYKRILLKLSGEALMGDDAFGINRATIVRMVREVAGGHRTRLRGGDRDRRRQHLPWRGGRLGRHGPRHGRLHGDAGHGDECAGARRHHARWRA